MCLLEAFLGYYFLLSLVRPFLYQHYLKDLNNGEFVNVIYLCMFYVNLQVVILVCLSGGRGL